MAEREVYNEQTGQYEFADDGRVDMPYTPPPPPPGPGPTPEEVAARYNGGSPPDQALQPDHGWEWDGWSWNQVQGRGKGWKATTTTTTTTTDDTKKTPPATDGRRGPLGGPAAPYTGSSGGIAGVPPSYTAAPPRAAYSGPAMPTGPVPTLASAMESAKQLKAAPTVNPYDTFTAPQEVGKAERDRLIQSILGNPQTMGQTQQDQLFEQQKEQQLQMGQQAKERLGQATAGRGLSAGGGAQQAGAVKLESGFIDSLMSGRRDISVKAADINRQNELAAVEMSNAVNSGDFARAQAAYETQLNAKKAYDELRFRAAEFDRSNIALAAQTDMASRQQQGTEAMASFQQYMDQLKFDEMMRQFNEQTALDYSKFGWDQQVDFSNMFPRT